MTRSVRELQMFMSDMHWTKEELIAQFYWAMCVGNRIIAEENEAEEEFAHLASKFNDTDWMDFHYAKMMGWV